MLWQIVEELRLLASRRAMVIEFESFQCIQFLLLYQGIAKTLKEELIAAERILQLQL